MKRNFTSLKACLLLLLLVVFAGNMAFSQTAVQVFLTNDAQVSPTEYQVDVVLVSTGSGTFQLSGHQYGINYNAAIKNGGTITASWVTGSTELTNPAQLPSSFNTASNPSQIRIAAPPAPGAGNGSIIATAPGIRVGRLKIVNSVAFAAAQPNLAFNFTSNITNTRTSISFYNGTANAIFCNPPVVTTGCTGTSVFTVNTSNPILNAPTCTAPTLSGVVTNLTCQGANNGAIDLTITGGTPTPLSVLWSNGATTEDISGLAPGAYTVTVTTDGGQCTATSTFTVNDGSPSTTNTTTATGCDSYTWTVDGNTYTQSGTYSNVNGCTTEILALTITPSASNTTTASACGSYTWAVNGNTYTQSGTYSSVNGCTTEILALTITPATSNTTTASACDSYTWTVNGTTYTQSGTYSSVSGCATETLVLTITPSGTNTTTASACDSYTWSANGTTYTQSGTYSSVIGCSTEILVLTITPSSSNTTTASACDSYTWSVNGTTYTQSGTYSSVSGCATEILVLTITPSTSNTTPASACGSYTWAVNGTTYTQSGTYSSVSGCATEILVLTITPSTSNTTPASACGSYTWAVNGTTYTQSGTYSSVSGCATEILVLTITPSTSNTTTASACGSYTWAVNGTTYTQSGTYSSVTGCATEILVLTITPSTSNTTTASACGSYTWAVNGTTYTQSGTYSSVSGCATEILVLTITPSTSNTTTASACGSYTWAVNGTTYTQSGTYSSVTGCATEILVLTITPSTSNTTPASACGSYTWAVNGTTYTQSGTYSSVSGCATEILVLTITPSTSNTTTASACGSYTWAVNGTTYTQSGTYSSVTGCATEILVLTITPSTSNTTTASACGSYTWAVNGTTYTQSGTYSSVTGCATQILVLTITPPGTNTTTASACGSYTWAVNGTTYTQSGTYSSVTGCSTEILVLTITPSTSNTTTASACNSYTWTVNGTTYTQSGTYSSVSGCATEILVLTITPSTSNTTPASACSSYTWAVNGTTYTQSGTYSSVSGCATQILVLTITQPVNYYTDADNDGYGTGTPVSSCTPVPGTATVAGDCNDNNSAVNPGAAEECGNGIDDDCDSQVDEGCGCSNPPTANAGVDIVICNTAIANLSGSFGGGATSATWTTSGDGSFTPNASTLNAAYIPGPNDITAGSVNIVLTTNAPILCNAAADTLVLTIQQGGAATPGPISGPTSLCNPNGVNVTYSISAVSGALSYSWTVPNGTVIVSGQGTTSLTVRWPFSAIHAGVIGDICVSSVSACGSSSTSCLGITMQLTTPVMPPTISGPNKVCAGTLATYSTGNVARAITYNWTVPTGVTILNGQGTNIINVQYLANFAGGNITVNGVNGCGSGVVRSKAIMLNLLTASASITGQSTGLCASTGVVYTAVPVTGATSYLWTVPPSATIVSGQGTNSITVDFGNFNTGSVTVAAQNGCGNGSVRSLTVTGAPGQPTPITGPVVLCPNQIYAYSVGTTAGATTYTWTVPSGFQILNNTQGTKNLDVRSGGNQAVGQVIAVRASNACGVSPARTLTGISITGCGRSGRDELQLLSYPNPTSDVLNVVFTSESNEDVVVSFFDASGRLVLTENRNADEGYNNFQLSLNALAKGIYTMQLRTSTMVGQQLVVVK